MASNHIVFGDDWKSIPLASTPQEEKEHILMNALATLAIGWIVSGAIAHNYCLSPPLFILSLYAIAVVENLTYALYGIAYDCER